MHSELHTQEFLRNDSVSSLRSLYHLNDTDEYNTPRDPSISINEQILDSTGSELGFFYFLMLGCVFILLNQVDGKIFRLKIFLMNRDFHLVENEGFVRFVTRVLRLLSWVSLLMPFMSLAIWAAGLIIRAKDFNQYPVGGICVLLVGMSFFFFAMGTLYIKWNHYQMGPLSAIFFFLAFCCLTGYQFVAVFLSKTLSFFGTSCIFLNANCMIMYLMLYINSHIHGGSIRDLLLHKMDRGEPKDVTREDDFLEEIKGERANKSFIPTYEDVIDLFTIAKSMDFEKASAFGGGVQFVFNTLSVWKRRLINLFLWSFATGILVAYSYVIYYNMNNSLLGFVIMIVVLITDVFTYIFYNSKILSTQTPLAVILLLNRLLLYVFGGEYWLYGWLLLFIFYGVILSFRIANRRFPFEDAFADLNLDTISRVSSSLDVSRVPEFLACIITTIYAGLFTILYVVEPEGVPLKPLNIEDWEYSYYVNAVFCLLLLCAFFTVIAIYRLFIRKMKRIEPRIHFFIKNHKFDLYWIFMVLNFLLTVTIGLIAYWITDKWSVFVLITLIDFFILAYVNAYLHYILNDYDFLQDIKQLNLKITKHNERLTDLKEKVNKFKKDVKEGNAAAIGEASLGLAQNIIKNDQLKKKSQKELKKIAVANEQLKATVKQSATNVWASMTGQPTLFTNNKQSQKVQPTAVSTKVQPQLNNSTLQNSPTREPPAKTTVNPTTVRDEADKLVEEEMNQAKGAKDDEMYEGGEDEEQSNNDADIRAHLRGMENELDQEGGGDEDESTDEELDPEGGDENADERRQKRRMKDIKDWRLTHNAFQAFWTGRLRHNDYQIINSLILGHAALAICAWLVCNEWNNYLGITIVIPLVHYGMAIFSLIKHLSTDARMQWYHYFFFFSAYVIQYGWGIANLYLSYTLEQLDPSKPGSAEAGSYIVVYLMVIPFITSCATAIFKWIDDKGKVTPFFIIQLALTILQGIGMLVLAYVYMTYIQGIIVSCIVTVISYIVFQVWIYVKNDYYMPLPWTIINLVIVGGLIVSALVVSFFVQEFRIFLGFSISTWIFAILLGVFAFAEIMSDYSKIETKPVFFSPWIFPVYIYNPKKNDVESKNLPAISMLSCFIVLILWSILASVWLSPVHIGVALTILFELAMLICIMFVISISSFQLNQVTKDIDKKIIRRAWLDAKQGYLSGRTAMNRASLKSFETMIFRRNSFRNYMRHKEGRDFLTLEERSEGIIKMEKDEIDMEWIDESQVNLSSQVSCYSYLYEIEQHLSRVYRLELELIIQFQLLIVQQAENLHEQKKKYLFTFLNEKKAALFALGIVIQIPDQGSMKVRYARVITQIQKLSPEKQTMFNHLRDHYIQEQRDIEEKNREKERQEELKEKERQEMLAQMSEEKRKKLAAVTMDTPLDEMPDCEMKFSKILSECNPTKPFTDVQFKADGTALGPGCQNRGVGQWVRARDKPNCVLFKDKINHLDVVQGALGDCYFLSAISVLGDKYVKRIIVSTEEQWRQTGSFMVQFFKNGEPEIIIIDDYFPAYMSGDWIFVKGGLEGDELWPMVLEKAYAKMYGTYNYIEAGKVQYALSDMTDGFPEQMDLKVEGKNIQVFWEKIKSLKRHGALMGAGSPEHSMGDRAINEMGIVQGHAYSVLDIQEVDDNRLMQLRNPHGSSGEEWKGDWSDTSLKWTQRMRNKAGYQDSSRDGVFWMDVLDFVQQYSYLYICRILDPTQGWKEVRKSGRWEGASAEGLPSRQRPNARLDFNPQFEITVTKPCDGFISLMQFDRENMFRGKHAIFFMVAKSNGKRISKVDKQTMICRSGNPINLNIVTAECDFDKSVSYPYKFTLLIANAENGKEGEGDFEVAVYATDPNIRVNELQPAKDFPKSSGGGGAHEEGID